MPFKSKKQMKWAFATGKMGPGKAEEWADETPSISELPERAEHSASKSALESMEKSPTYAALTKKKKKPGC